jgi:hypothetical protein
LSQLNKGMHSDNDRIHLDKPGAIAIAIAPVVVAVLVTVVTDGTAYVISHICPSNKGDTSGT